MRWERALRGPARARRVPSCIFTDLALDFGQTLAEQGSPRATFEEAGRNKRNASAEILHQHEVASALVILGVEQPMAVRRHG